MLFPEFAAHCPLAGSVEEDAWFLRRDNKDQLILGKYFFGSLFYLLCDLLPVRMQGTVSWQCQRGSVSVAVAVEEDVRRFQLEETAMMKSFLMCV